MSCKSIFAAIACASVATLSAAPLHAAPKPVVGQPAPPFAVTTIDKQKISLESLRGQVVLLNYWATWCAPCKAEMPMMNRFHIRYKKAGFTMIGVTTEDSLPSYKLKKLDDALSYPLATRMKTRAYDGTGSVPASYVIDRLGVLRHIKVGAFDEDEFNALMLPLLAESPPQPAPK